MIPGDPNVQRVELVAVALGELREQLVLVGGCAVSLLIDSATASPPRVTLTSISSPRFQRCVTTMCWRKRWSSAASRAIGPPTHRSAAGR